MDPAKAHRTVCKNKGCVPGSGDGSQCSSWAGGKEKKGQHGQLGQRETGTGNGVGQAKGEKKGQALRPYCGCGFRAAGRKLA